MNYLGFIFEILSTLQNVVHLIDCIIYVIINFVFRAKINVNQRKVMTVAIKSGIQQTNPVLLQKPLTKPLIQTIGNRVPMTAANSDQLKSKLNASFPMLKVVNHHSSSTTPSSSFPQQKIHAIQFQKGQPLLHTPNSTMATLKTAAKPQQTGQNAYSFTDLIAEVEILSFHCNIYYWSF